MWVLAACLQYLKVYKTHNNFGRWWKSTQGVFTPFNINVKLQIQINNTSNQ